MRLFVTIVAVFQLFSCTENSPEKSMDESQSGKASKETNQEMNRTTPGLISRTDTTNRAPLIQPGSPPAPVAAGSSPLIPNTSGNIERAWIFEVVRGYRNGQILADTTGLHLFNNAMKGNELRFSNGKFSKKSGETNTGGEYNLSKDKSMLTMIENGQFKKFKVMELSNERLIIQSVELATLVVVYSPK